MENQIMTAQERIARYEEMMDNALKAAQRLEDALADFEAALSAVDELESYYAGPEWKADYAADEAGQFSASLKRGVLSEDGLYDLLERYKELKDRIRS